MAKPVWIKPHLYTWEFIVKLWLNLPYIMSFDFSPKKKNFSECLVASKKSSTSHFRDQQKYCICANVCFTVLLFSVLLLKELAICCCSVYTGNKGGSWGNCCSKSIFRAAGLVLKSRQLPSENIYSKVVLPSATQGLICSFPESKSFQPRKGLMCSDKLWGPKTSLVGYGDVHWGQWYQGLG